MSDRERPWWLAWTNRSVAVFNAVLATVLFVFFTLVWLPGKNWFAAAVYVVLSVAGVYAWWNVWYLDRRWNSR